MSNYGDFLARERDKLIRVMMDEIENYHAPGTREHLSIRKRLMDSTELLVSRVENEIGGDLLERIVAEVLERVERDLQEDRAGAT